MYVEGNWNDQTSAGSCAGQNGTTTPILYTYPSALMADAITVLSSGFVDCTGYYVCPAMLPSASGVTTVNAAMLEGIVQTNPTNTDSTTPGMNGDYSGGVENFIRLLENWNGDTLTYNGSIVVLFYSQYATNSWRNPGTDNTKNYYDPPTRHWAFDLNFENPDKIPAMTPQLKVMVRGNWWAHK
jgi:hypothetical protein